MLLANERYGDPDLLDVMESKKHAVEWANRRREAAAERVRANQDLLAAAEGRAGKRLNTYGNVVDVPPDAGEIAVYSRRLRRWKIELAAADEALAVAKQESTRLYQQILDE
jgi:hypothetical protein